MNSAEKRYLYFLNELDQAIKGDINLDNNHETEYMYSDQTGDVMICYAFKGYHQYRLSLWQDVRDIDDGSPEILTYIFPVNYGTSPEILDKWHFIFDMKH